ncbi:hypothetical protein ASPWEDRAFT_407124 [Aspergillus wentii DTO 134E9]|uniref:Uncharacterized protein n=1 Tax=Aspergillus wentii DTO 134E9 TaxID=1073089 RepID=A0A1L9RNC3_ASPWE|nr:uncharacterized protein ASPWEDRAFT_407124 [Aspergillus wentii DTO 134E9]OJJ36459.1 hypothetical protein ASPWEDRAFT_407124 [Aspergillus wentii DTO 134E9]
MVCTFDTHECTMAFIFFVLVACCLGNRSVQRFVLFWQAFYTWASSETGVLFSSQWGFLFVCDSDELTSGISDVYYFFKYKACTIGQWIVLISTSWALL